MFRLYSLIVLIVSVSSLNVGYIYSDSSDGSKNIKIITDYSKLLLNNTEYEINIDECKYTGRLSMDIVNDCMKKYEEAKITLIFAICESFLYTVSEEYFERTKALIWCVNTITPGRCLSHYIVGNSVVSVLNTLPFVIGDYIQSTAYIGGGTKIDNDYFYMQHLTTASDSVGEDNIYTINSPAALVTDEKIKEYVEIMKNSNSTRIATYFHNNNIDRLNTLITEMYAANLNTTYNPIIYLPGGLTTDQIRTITDIAKNVDNIYITGYVINANTTDNDYLKTVLHQAGSDYYTEAYHMGLTKLLCYAIQNTYSTNPYVLLTTLYDRIFDYPGGQISILANHYTTTTYYGLKFDATGQVSVKYTFPIMMRFEPNGTIDEVFTETCNFTLNPETGEYSKDYLNILVVQSVKGEFKFSQLIIRKMLIEYIDEININGGVLDKELQLVYENMDEEDLENTIYNILNKTELYNIHTIFLFSTPEERTKISSEVYKENDDVLFFYFGPVEGEECVDNVIYTQPISTAYILTVVTHLASLPTREKIFIVSSKYSFANHTTRYLINELSALDYSEKDLPFSDLVSNNDTYIQNIVEHDVKYFLPTGGIIILTCEEEFQYPLLRAFKSANMTSENGYSIISLNVNSIALKILGYDMFENHKYLSHYNEGNENENYNFLIKYHDVINMMMNDYYPISGTMGILYNIYQQWEQAVKLCGYTNPKQYKKYIYHQPTPDPAEGPYEIYYNGYAQGKLRILEVSKDGDYTKVMEDTFARQPQTYQSGKQTCDWHDTNVVPGGAINSYIIGVLYDVRTANGVKRYNELRMIVELINQDGGVNGRQLVVNQTNYDDDYKNIITAAKQLIDDPDFLCFFGTQSEEERQAIEPLLEEKDKLLFVFLDSNGEVTYKNIIQMSYITHQYETYQMYWLFEHFQHFVIVHTNDNITMERVNFIKSLGEFVGREDSGTYIYDGGNATNITIDIETKFPNDKSVCIITILGSLTGEFLLYYNESTLTPDTAPLLITDFTLRLMNDYDSKLFYNHFGGEAFYRRSKKSVNVALFNYIETYKGNPDDNVNQNMLVMYNTIQILVSALDGITSLDSQTLRDKLYNVRLDLPNGLMGITSNNYATSHFLIVKIDDNKDVKEYMDLPYPIMPHPWYFLNNNQNYYTTDFSISGSGDKVSEDYYGIAFFLDIADAGNRGFLDFILVNMYIETANYNGGVKNKMIYSEVYQCPIDDGEAAKRLMILYRRKFKIIIGGCSLHTRDIMTESLEALEFILLYTGPNSGQQCSKNIISMSTHPTQDVLPSVLHLLYQETRSISFIYSTEVDYEGQVKMIESIFEAFDIDFADKKSIDPTSTSTLNIDIESALYSLHQRMSDGGAILLLLSKSTIELFLQIFYEYFSESLNINDSNEIADIFTLYIIDNTHTEYNPLYSNGHYVYSPYDIDESNTVAVSFEKSFQAIADNQHATYQDALLADAIQIMIKTLENAASSDFDVIRKELYSTEVESVLGNTKIDSGNVMIQNMNFAKIVNGVVTHVSTLSSKLPGEAYRVEFNRKIYAVCNWLYNYEYLVVDVIYIGLILPSNIIYRKEGIEFYQGIYTAIEYQNRVNNGINGKYIIPITMVDGDDAEYAQEQMRKNIKDYNIFIFLGGWTTEIRNALQEVALNTSSIIFYPNDYEGEECHFNGYYLGLSYSSFFTFAPLIKAVDEGNTILLYSNTYYSTYFAQHLTEDLGVFDVKLLLSLQIPVENEDMTEVVSLISRIAPRNGIILNLLDGNSKISLIKIMKDNNLVPPKYYSYNLNYDDLTVAEVGDAIDGNYIFDSYDTNSVTNSLLTILNDEFTSYFTFQETTNKIIGRGVIAIEIISNVGSQCNNVTYEEFRSKIYTTKTNTILGELTFAQNNQLPNVITVESNTINPVDGSITNIVNYRTQENIISKPFGNILRDETVKRCDLRVSDNIETISVKYIAVIFSVAGSEKKTHENAIYGALTALHYLYDNEKVNDNILLMKLIDYDSDNEILVEKLKELDGDDSIVAYLGCTSAICKQKVQESANKNNKLFYYPRLTVGQECDYNTITTSMVANQYVTRFLEYLISTKYESYIYLITEESTACLNLMSIFEDAAKGLFTTKGDYIVSNSNPLTINVVEDITNNYLPDGGIIITVFLTPGYLKKFLEYQNKIHIDHNKWGIADALLEIEDTTDIPNEHLTDLMKYSRYFMDINTQTNVKFGTRYFHYTAQKAITSLAESSYSGILLYAKAAQNAKSFDTDLIRSISHGISIESGSGTVQISDNNYVDSPFFVAQFKSDGSYSTIYSKYDVQTPSPWSWNIDSTYGLMCSFATEQNSQYEVPVKRTVLIASLTGSYAIDTQGLVDIYQMAINDINNNNGGIGGYTIKPDVFDVQSNNEYCKIEIPKYMIEFEPLVIFAAITPECYDTVYKQIETKPILYVELNKKPQDFCNSNVLVAVEHSTLYDPIIDVIRNRFYDNILIVTSTGDEDTHETSLYIQSYFKKFYVDFVNYTAPEVVESELIVKLREYNQIINNTGCILYFGHVDSFQIFMNTLKSNGFTEPKHHVIVMENSNLFRSLDYYGYEEVEFYQSDEVSEINTQFKEKIYQRIDTTTYISDLMIRTYSSINLWSKAINSLPLQNTDGYMVANVDIKNVRAAILTVQDTLPEGLVYFGNNQYLARIPRLTLLNQDKSTTLIYTSLYARVPEAWANTAEGKFRKCDFTDANIEEDQVVTTYLIAIILSLSGKDREKETPILQSVLTAIDRVNLDSLLLDSYINYDLYNAESDINLYIKYAKDIANSTKYSYVFGGYSPETLTQIGHLFDNTNQFFFFLGKSLGTNCYSNTIISYLHPIQIADATIRRLLELSSSAFLIKSKDEYSNRIAQLITDKMQNLIITSNGNVVYNEGTTGSKIINDIQRALPNGGYILTVMDLEEDIIDFYDYFCKSSLKYPTYTIINVILNENIIHKLDASCLNGFIIIGSYFESIGNEEMTDLTIPAESTTFNTYFHIRIGNIYATSEHESAYSAFELWKNIVRKVNSFEYNDIKYLYHYYVDVPSDQLEVNPNNYFNRRVFAGTLDSNGNIRVNWGPTVTLKPKIYDQYNDSEIGYICDFSDENKGEHYNTNPIILSFIHEKDLGGKTEKYNALLQDMIISEINSLGGVLGRQLAANHTWLTINDAYRNVRSIVETGRSQTILGCITAECRNEVVRYLQSHDLLYFFTGRDDGYECNENTITSGLSMNQKVDALYLYMTTLELTYVYFVGSERNSTLTEYHLFEQKFNGSKFTFLGKSFFSPFNKQVATNVMNTIDALFEEVDRIALINLFIANENSEFLPYLTSSNNFASMTNIFLKYDPSDISSEYSTQLAGAYVVSSYAPSVSNTASGTFQYLTTSEYQNAIDLSELYETSYSTIYTWKAAVEYSKTYAETEWPDNEYIRLSLKYVSYDGPSGTSSIINNNHAKKNVYIFRLLDGDITQVYPKQGIEFTTEGKMTYIDDSTCSFSKHLQIYEVNDVLQMVTIVLDIINTLFCLGIALIVFVFRHTKVIKSASPLFLYYTLVSLIFLAAVGNVFPSLPTNQFICELRIWGLSLAIDFVFSIMFSKAWRIHKLFNNKELARVKVSNSMLLKMIGIILMCQIIYLIIWTVVKPSKPVLTFSAGYSTYLNDVYLQECTSNIIFVVIQLVAIALIFLWGARLAWSVRKASAEFNESMSLMSTIGLMLIMGVILVPLDYLMASEPDTLVILRSLGIEIGVFAVIILQFGSKLMYIWNVEFTTTFGSTSLLGGSSSMNSLHEKSQAMKRAAARGRFTVKPDLMQCIPITLATISESERFFDERGGRNNSVGTPTSFSRKQSSLAAHPSQRVSNVSNTNNIPINATAGVLSPITPIRERVESTSRPL